MEWEALVEPAVAERARRAAAGHDAAKALRFDALVAGEIGVVRSTIVALGLPKTFRRRSGGEGRLLRVTLRDATGEADLVLWDEEVVRAAAWRPGARLVLWGTAVKAGRDSLELALGTARIEIEGPTASGLTGILVAVSPTRTVDGGVQAEVEMAVAGGLATLVVQGGTVAHVAGLQAGTRLVWSDASAHPVLEGWWLVPPGSRPAASPTLK